jgi:hypothetical protein
MLITLSQAARVEGAPAQPSLSRMTKNKSPPGFLKKTGDGWRVDTDEPSWENLIAGRRGQDPAANAAKSRGAALARGRAAKTAADGGKKKKKEEDEKAAKVSEAVRNAIDAKIICSANREKLKMQQDEIKTNRMKGAFVERAEGEYWLSFMQRGIIDSFSAVDRCFAETKRLILAGNDTEGKQYLKGELKRGFERAVENLREAVNGAGDD